MAWLPEDFTPSALRALIFIILVLGPISLRYTLKNGWDSRFFVGVLCLLAISGLLWQAAVALIVHEPYLDEVFHIPQAQKYCEGSWLEWDNKITTPPGLYVFGVLIHKLFLVAGGDCSVTSLRMTNWIAIIFLAYTATQCRRLIEARLAERDGHQSRSSALSTYAIHTGVNIGLFPLLFFFSALYYTDVFSSLMVLAAFQNHLGRIGPQGKTWLNDLWVVCLGVAGLFMRQTNVFWVVVFMGGLEAVHALRTLRPEPVNKPERLDFMTIVRFYAWRYSLGEIHDPTLNLAWPDDALFCVVSIAIAVLCNPLRVLKQVWAHVVVMGLFAAFVLWNGSVVLGDKSNHVATLHLPQMLYIWPLFAFFSAPLLLPYMAYTVSLVKGNIARAISSFFRGVPNAPSALDEVSNPTRHPLLDERDKEVAACPVAFQLFSHHMNSFLIFGIIIIAHQIVRYNTIIHPFTLADNRHYMFYVFRYTILRPGLVRYQLIPCYMVLASLCRKALGGCDVNYHGPQGEDCPVEKQAEANALGLYSRPFTNALNRYFMIEAHDWYEKRRAAEAKDTSGDEDTPEKPQPAALVHDYLDNAASTSAVPPSLSTAVLWLLATTLSLITAPLVEPRYFILPWIFWRLFMPAWPAHLCLDGPALPADHLLSLLSRVWPFTTGRRVDLRLWLETAWFLVIHVVTAYMFLMRPYYWRAEDGTLLDGGRLQRFMW